ncbi:transcriptional corepressor LEUNIG isoform X6 [Lathyrus oleraceus]|uniref:transcriptional corepressor LEUNIG isoform X6 n=1 Tax=Pisum sativum TaxID=3888 RepID=UPI0021D0A185|nr:transcriptional corepressor LEUNIG-like isoform X6 [Pisum sativum]
MDSNNNDSLDVHAMFRYFLHDYLIKKGMYSTAAIFMNETTVPQTPTYPKCLDLELDSPDGFLHEWWSIFYETYLSRVKRHQGSDPQSSNKMVSRLTNTPMDDSSTFRIPQMPMIEQRSQQFQASSSFNSIIAQQASHLMIPSRLQNNEHLGNFAENIDPSVLALFSENNPDFFSGISSIHPSQDVGNQLQKQVYKDSGIRMRVGPPIPRNPLDARQKAMLPLDGAQVTNNYEAPNFVPTNGLQLNNQMLTSLSQIPNCGQHPQVLNRQNQDAVLSQELTSTSNGQIFTAPRISTRCNGQVTNYEAPNFVPTNGLRLNNQMLTSLSQMPNYGQQPHVLNRENQDAILDQGQEPTSTSNSQTFTTPRVSTRCNGQYPEIPKNETSNKDREILDQVIVGEPQCQPDLQMQMQSQNLDILDQIIVGEPQCKPDLQMQMQSQNLDNRAKRKITDRLGPEEPVLDCVDVADEKPEDENVDSYLSIEDGNSDHRTMPFKNLKRISGTNSRNENKDFSLQEIGCLHSSKSKVLASHFSSNGKILASAGHDKKVFIWKMDTFNNYATEETHSLLITDVRFRPGSTIFATSSFDKSVRVWDADRPKKSLFSLSGHSEQVMSLDFHPSKVDLLCSCDSNDIIRMWNVNQRSILHITKGGSKQVRFQPVHGKFIATATGNIPKLIDVQTAKVVCNLKAHDKDVASICWDRSGKFLASVSEDCARVWSDGKCISELLSNGNKFQSCVFHPTYSNLLVIGGYQNLEFWSPIESSRTMSVMAHKGLIAGLADSPEDELIASASHDCLVKIWR